MAVQQFANDEEMRESIMTDLEQPPSSFALRVRGNSMEPEFREGDIIIVNPTIPPKPGSYVVASDETGEATFKLYRDKGRNPEGRNIFELVPLNPDYATIRSDAQQVAIVGVVVQHRRDLKV
jgi:SOS-response transcriptional repressor LexA